METYPLFSRIRADALAPPPLPIALFPVDCLICGGPIPATAPTCPQCGTLLFMDGCESDAEPAFSGN